MPTPNPSFHPPHLLRLTPLRHHNPLSKTLLPKTCTLSSPPQQKPLHIPVLLPQILHTFSNIRNTHPLTIIDGTIGLGGHADAIIDNLGVGRIERYVGIDKDVRAVNIAREVLRGVEGVDLEVVCGDFGELGSVLREVGVGGGESVDGVLLDVGVSSMQVDDASRGFSFLRDGPLDMRMDCDGEGGGLEGSGRKVLVSARDVVNRFSYEELVRVFVEGGEEERRAGVMAGRVVKGRRKIVGGFRRTRELAECLSEGKRLDFRGLHPATLCFQALRIYVNGELKALRNVIPKAIECLRPGGRLAIVSFHSGEDGIVKRMFKEAEDVRVLTKKPIVAERGEIKKNPRSRSAKLRVVEKLAPGEEAKVNKKKNKYRAVKEESARRAASRSSPSDPLR